MIDVNWFFIGAIFGVLWAIVWIEVFKWVSKTYKSHFQLIFYKFTILWFTIWLTIAERVVTIPYASLWCIRIGNYPLYRYALRYPGDLQGDKL